MSRSEHRYGLDVNSKVVQAPRSPGQLCRKETPPLQQAAGPSEPLGAGDVTGDASPPPPRPPALPPFQRTNLSLSHLLHIPQL